jgi:tetratricopeptide (TPR) repeat protein
MKLQVVTLIISILCPLTAISQFKPVALSEDDAADIKQKLNKFERGKLSLEDLTEKGGQAFDAKLASYYLAHTNEVSAKSLLPIARCFAFFGYHDQAAGLAKQYVQVYSNDWHGWRILGSAKLGLANFEEALPALTNAVTLGDKDCCSLVSMCALKLNRLDIVKDSLPCLFDLKENAKEKSDRTDAIFMIVAYAANADREDLFVKALADVKAEDVAARSDLTKIVTALCDRFQAKQVQPLCEKLKANAIHQ